jgi:hypothetical protein
MVGIVTTAAFEFMGVAAAIASKMCETPDPNDLAHRS